MPDVSAFSRFFIVAIPYSGTFSIFSLSRNGNIDVFTAKSGLNLSQNRVKLRDPRFSPDEACGSYALSTEPAAASQIIP